MIDQINGSVFDEKVRKAARPVAVDFYGKCCVPCTKLLPVLEVVAVEMAGRIDFVKIDVEDAGAIAAEFGVTTVPTIIVFKDGWPVDKVEGLLSKHSLVSRIEAVTS